MAGNADDPMLPEDKAGAHESAQSESAWSGASGAGSAPSGSVRSESAPSPSAPSPSTPSPSTPSEASGAGSAAAESPEHKPAKKPLARTFHCTNCGAPVTIRYPGAAMTVVCSGCHSIIDATDENCKILTKFFKSTKAFEPQLPLGSRGQLKGRTWEVIGFMVRFDVSSLYSWNEYLLFNPYYGYRWLTEDKGHWNFVTTIKRKPDKPKASQVFLDGRKYQIFNSGTAQVDYVIGEFYWRVVVGAQVEMIDYIDPPQMLSLEKDDKEVVWSLSEYIESGEIEKAFKPPNKLHWQTGVSPTQPAKSKAAFDKIKILFLAFCVIITCCQYYFAATALNQSALQYSGTFTPNVKQSDITTPVFVLNKDKANVAITVSAPVDNSWFWVSGEMVNNDTGISYPFEQTVEYYSGYDSDGAWTEGGNSAKHMFASVPGGKYYMNLDTENGSFKTTDPVAFQVNVQRDLPTFDNYWWTLLFLSVLPIISWMLMRRTEVARWSNSDFSPYV
jgi:hypothetical protein